MGTFSGSQAGWQTAGGEFTLDFTEGAGPRNGDLVQFITLSAARDANTQKKLYFAESDTTWNGGKARLIVDSSGTFKAVGTAAYPTIIDWLPSGGTHYTFISSGALVRMEDFYMAHAGTDGLKFLTNPSTMTIKNGTFDYGMGSGSGNAYIQLSSVTTAATLDGISFKDSGLTTPFNVKVGLDDTGLEWNFINWSGERGGSGSESDPNGRISWTAADVTVPDLISLISIPLADSTDKFTLQ